MFEIVDLIKEELKEIVTQSVKKYPFLQYGDVRLEVRREKSASARDGKQRSLKEIFRIYLGFRCIGGDKISAPGYYGKVLGESSPGSLLEEIRNGFEIAYHRAIINSKEKAQFKKQEGTLGNTLVSTELAPIEIIETVVKGDYDINPESVSLEEMAREVTDVSLKVKEQAPEVNFNTISVTTFLSRMLFVSSEGSLIDQTIPVTEAGIFVVAGRVNEGHADSLGSNRGWEVIRGKNSTGETLEQFALRITAETIELAKAPELIIEEPRPFDVVLDPHYNALLSHEIIGHPTEADRVLKMETAYAGRSWFFESFANHQLGRQVASSLVSVISDPTMDGFGYQPFDAEGVRGKRVPLIERGILKNFQNSRETAALLGHQPNGCMRANDASLVPIVRMTNVFFAKGQSDPQKIIEEVEDGFYLAGHRTPSISESRENFRITARKTYRIKKGKLVQLYRNGGITADSKDFLMSINAVGTDFINFPIPNCGKGIPTQVMRVGNGGPTLRGVAKVTGRS